MVIPPLSLSLSPTTTPPPPPSPNPTPPITSARPPSPHHSQSRQGMEERGVSPPLTLPSYFKHMLPKWEPPVELRLTGTALLSSTSVMAELVLPHWPPQLHNSFHMTFFLLLSYQRLKDVGKVVSIRVRLWFIRWFVSLLLRAKMSLSYRELFANYSCVITEWLLDRGNKRCFIYPAMKNDFYNMLAQPRITLPANLTWCQQV